MKLLKPYDYYLRLINNLEYIIKNDSSVPETGASLHQLGAFLYSRSTEFEMLQKQDSASVFLSILKSNEQNVLHIFQYYFSGSVMINNRKDTAGKELLIILDKLNEMILSYL